MKGRFVLLLILAALAPALSAQGFKVVPERYATMEAYSAFSYPWSYRNMHFQHLIRGGEICKTGALMQGIRYRTHGLSRVPYAASKGAFEVTLFETPIGPRQMTKTWANNRSVAKGTLAFKGTLNVPAVPLVTSPTAIPRAFTLQVPFAAPYTYTLAKGNLLIEIFNRETYAFSSWGADTYRQEMNRLGERGFIGMGCNGRLAEEVTLAVDASKLHIGGGIEVTTSYRGTQGALVWLGYQRLAKPTSLSFLGAPSCYLYSNIVLTRFVSTSGGKAIWPIPAVSLYADATLFLQAIGISPAANPPGVAVSDAWFLRIGSNNAFAQGAMQSVYRTKDNSGATGYMSGTDFFAPVIRIDGVFY